MWTDDTLENLLEAWAAFVRLRWRPLTCGSAEGLYRPERVADDEQRRPRPREWSVPELWNCERAVSALPMNYSQFIRLIWVAHQHPCAVCSPRSETIINLRFDPRERRSQNWRDFANRQVISTRPAQPALIVT